MMSIIYLIMSGACLTHLWLVSHPLEPLRAYIRKLAVTPGTNRLMYGLMKLTECALCSGFWIGVGLGLACSPVSFQILLNAALTSISAELLHRKMTKINF